VNSLDPAEIGLGQFGEHLQAKVGDEAVAKITDGDVGYIFGDRLDRRDDDDRDCDPSDHVCVFGHEHIVRRALNQKGNGTRCRRREQHGEDAAAQQHAMRAQVLPPNALNDLTRRVVPRRELIAPTSSHAGIYEDIVFQELSRFSRGKDRTAIPSRLPI